ncbi:unnamed protein product [Lactuca virosa]|uniref:Protein kinase domain-containing protein n=1 Tax=Lactuca virosa TaxID=75947 RepID=A0AAU9PJ24_9ASTR|nr:unnamed protein product [Lactuca virosa]
MTSPPPSPSEAKPSGSSKVVDATYFSLLLPVRPATHQRQPASSESLAAATIIEVVAALGYVHGANVVHAFEPVHGRLSEIQHNGCKLFHDISFWKKVWF